MKKLDLRTGFVAAEIGLLGLAGVSLMLATLRELNRMEKNTLKAA